MLYSDFIIFNGLQPSIMAAHPRIALNQCFYDKKGGSRNGCRLI